MATLVAVEIVLPQLGQNAAPVTTLVPHFGQNDNVAITSVTGAEIPHMRIGLGVRGAILRFADLDLHLALSRTTLQVPFETCA